MATTIPAMKAKLGSTEYYILSMKAQGLVEKTRLPKEVEGWEDLSIEEIWQRDINYGRVRNQIAPYLAGDEDRFFGAIIVAAMNFDPANFEPLLDVATKGLPGRYRVDAATMGFLTFQDGEVWLPLDGQHRLAAIRSAISGKDEKGRNIGEMKPCIQLAQDDVTVILVNFEPARARKIFTKVNRYAKPTTKGQNIITDDDDVVAVITREIANDIIGGRLVKYTGNTLTRGDGQFTTLSILYDCNEMIITNNFPVGSIDKTQMPEKAKVHLYRQKVREVWETLIDKITLFADALSDREESGDDKRREIRQNFLLGKPIPQACLVKAFVRLIGLPTNLKADEACRRLNRLPWGITSDDINVWDRVLWSGGKILAKSSNVALATDLVAYLAGQKFSSEEEAELLKRYRGAFPEDEREKKQLPKPVAS